MSSQSSEGTDNHKGVRIVSAELNSKDQESKGQSLVEET